MTKVYHITFLDKDYPNGKIECIKKFKTKEEAEEFIKSEHDTQLKTFGEILDKYFL